MKTRIDNSAGRRRRPLPLAGAVAALVLGATGCATVYSTTPGALDGLAYKGVDGPAAEHVYIKTKGFYFMWTLPLASGDLRWNEATQTINGGTCFFEDQVGVSELQEALLKIADTRNCDVVDIAFNDSDTSYAGVSTGGVIGMLFGSSEIGMSGVLVPRKTASATPAEKKEEVAK